MKYCIILSIIFLSKSEPNPGNLTNINRKKDTIPNLKKQNTNLNDIRIHR